MMKLFQYMWKNKIKAVQWKIALLFSTNYFNLQGCKYRLLPKNVVKLWHG